MKKQMLCIVELLGIFSLLFSQTPPDTLWTKNYGGYNDDGAYSLQQTFDGGYIIAGGTESFGAGGNDVYLIKTNEDGDTVWTKACGGARDDEGYSVQQTSDSGYIVVGSTYSFGAAYEDDAWLIKTDSKGDTIWTKRFGETNHPDRGYSVQQTNEGGYIITGCTESYGLNYTHAWLIKTDSSGNKVWDKTFGGADTVSYGRSVRQTNDGGYIITGWKDYSGTSDYDVWLIKTDSLGNKLWDKIWGRGYYDYGRSVQQTNDGGYIVTGDTRPYSTTNSDVWLIKTDVNGDTVWTKTYGGTADDRGWSVQQTSSGGYILTGYTASYGASGGDAWLIKTDSSGNKLWDKTFGGSAYDYCRSVRQTNDGGYIVAGETSSYGSGGKDVYLIRLTAEVVLDDYPLQAPLKNYDLYQNYPNPFNTQTTISFSNLKAGWINISIYNIIGQKIKTLADGKLRIGHHQVIWSGKDENDMPVSSGIYFYKMETANFSVIRKCILLK
jgi:hypothetical protein